MLLTIILFLIGIATCSVLVARKIWLLRSGQIVPGSYEEADWTDISLIAIRTRIIEVLRLGVHHGVLLALKGWILLSHSVRKADRRVKEKLMHVIHKNAQYPEGTVSGTPSAFLAGMKERKTEIAEALKKESEEIAE